MPHEAKGSTQVHAFAIRVLIGASVVIGLLLLLLLLWWAMEALLLTFAAILAAIVLRTLSDWVAIHTGMGDKWALMLVLGGGLFMLAGLMVLVAPQVTEQAAQLQQRLPEAIGVIHETLRERAWGEWLLDLLPTQEELEEQDGMGGVVWQATGFAYTAVQIFAGIVILIFVTIYLSFDPRLYINGILHLVPLSHRPRAAEVLGAAGATLRWWLFGTLLKMIAVGLLTFVGLWALDVPLAMLLAIIAGLLDFVPYVGPIIAALPAILIGFTGGLELAFWVAVVYLVVQQLESLVISPVIYQRTVYMPPALTILAEIILLAMAGAIGLILATPLMALTIVLVKMLYVEQVLGDRDIPHPQVQLIDSEALHPDREETGGDSTQHGKE
ncbi:AI-2E family transporter [Thiohalomonas denitrificans]|uniref:Predicted PurR-regulated permease PerM n=1 Tax=Thiohalomonas denitrificans TaxID=415747 RepID=A0A1G5QML1_9GAMM|nr:AI-2E family transporter [Thiohalomonas denitrificans]SCZ62790.1 Predicted PurR-regulated permease PerM [Thiohalomonas denitrificans]